MDRGRKPGIGGGILDVLVAHPISAAAQTISDAIGAIPWSPKARTQTCKYPAALREPRKTCKYIGRRYHECYVLAE